MQLMHVDETKPIDIHSLPNPHLKYHLAKSPSSAAKKASPNSKVTFLPPTKVVQHRPNPMKPKAPPAPPIWCQLWHLHHLQNLHGTLPSTGVLAGLEASIVHHHIAGQSLPAKRSKKKM